MDGLHQQSHGPTTGLQNGYQQPQQGFQAVQQSLFQLFVCLFEDDNAPVDAQGYPIHHISGADGTPKIAAATHEQLYITLQAAVELLLRMEEPSVRTSYYLAVGMGLYDCGLTLKYCPYQKQYCAPIRQMHMLAQKVIDMLSASGHPIKLAFLPYRELIECDQRKDWWQVMAILRCAASDSPYTSSVCLSMISLPCCRFSSPLAPNIYSNTPMTPGGTPMQAHAQSQQFLASQSQHNNFATYAAQTAGGYYSPQSPVPTMVITPTSGSADVKMEDDSADIHSGQSQQGFYSTATAPAASGSDFIAKQSKSLSQPSYLAKQYKYGGNGRSISFGTQPQAAVRAVAANAAVPNQESPKIQPFQQMQQTSPQFIQSPTQRNLTPGRTRSPSIPFSGGNVSPSLKQPDNLNGLGETPVTQAVAKILTAKYGRTVDGPTESADESMDDTPSAPTSSTVSRDGSPLHRALTVPTAAPHSPVYPQPSPQQQAMHGGFGTFDSNLNQVSILSAPHFVNVGYTNGLSEDDRKDLNQIVPVKFNSEVYVPIYATIAFVVGSTESATTTDARRWLNRAPPSLHPSQEDDLPIRVLGALPRVRYTRLAYAERLLLNQKNAEVFVPNERLNTEDARKSRWELLQAHIQYCIYMQTQSIINFNSAGLAPNYTASTQQPPAGGLTNNTPFAGNPAAAGQQAATLQQQILLQQQQQSMNPQPHFG